MARLVILDKGFAFDATRDHRVSRLPVGQELRFERRGQLTLVVGSEDAEQVGDRAVDHGALAREHLPRHADRPPGSSSTASSSRSRAPASFEVTAVTDSLCRTVSVTMPLRREKRRTRSTRSPSPWCNTSSPGRDDESKAKPTRDHDAFMPAHTVCVCAAASSHRCPACAPPPPSEGDCATTRAMCSRSSTSSDTGAPMRSGLSAIRHPTTRPMPDPGRAGSSTSLSARITARSTALRNSRRFPARCARASPARVAGANLSAEAALLPAEDGEVVMREQQDVLRALAECRQGQRDHVQTIEQIFTEPAGRAPPPRALDSWPRSGGRRPGARARPQGVHTSGH